MALAMTTSTYSLDDLVHRMRLHSQLCDLDAAAVLGLPFAVLAHDQFGAIMTEGDAVDFCFVVLSGMVERSRLGLDGGKQIMAFYVPGDPLNLDHLFIDRADDDLCAMRETRLALIARADLRQLMADQHGVAQAAMRIFAVDASISREWLVNLGQRTAEQRIAHLLCELQLRGENVGADSAGARSDRAYATPWGVNQVNIAEATGLTPVHVNRTLKAMEARGLLRSGRNGIAVDDWPRLGRVGEFDSRYLHLGA